MLKKLSLISILLLTGCNYGTGTDMANAVANQITYSKANRTNLCFGSIASATKDGWAVISVTNVPCANVEFLISKPKVK